MKLRELVPEPLEVGEPLVNFEFIRMPDSTGFGDYTESGQVIPVTFKGRKGGYSHCMFLDDHPPIAGGRELWGFPKKLAKPTLVAEIDTLIGKLRDAIQARTIRFDNNVSLPAAGQDGILDAAAADLKELASLSASLSVSTKVMLTGHSDPVGGGTSNLSLSMARAEVVRALLKKRGVDPDMLMVRGAGPLELADPGAGDAARAANRRVSFTVAIGE